MRAFSLRKRLLLVATLVLVIALGLVGFALSEANYRGAVSALQARMESYVYLVLAAMEVDAEGRMAVDEDFTDPRLTQPASGVYVHVRGAKDQWNSASSLGLQWPDLPLAEPGLMSFHEPGIADHPFLLQYGVGWQLPDGRIEPFTVSVLVDESEILQQTSAFRMGLWRSLVAAGAILIIAQVVIFFFGFRPLRQVARDVARVESGGAARLEGHYPKELEPLARNVNRLLETEKSNQTRIRNALDSLAHSLKTPLAVIQAGLPLHGGKSEASMQGAVDEISRLIATRMERAGSSTRRTLAAPVAVQPQMQRVLGSLQKVYSHKMIAAELKLEEELQFYGEQRDLLELSGNLLDNAFKYGKCQVRVTGGVSDQAASRPGLWLRVEDDGPGIDESQWEHLLQRGSRGDEQVEGHGLGLAIVMELVTAYGGEVSIGHSELGGAMISVSIPAS
ncbi:MAG: histidine kinase [Xanthomonadales bacterium]|nr:histidine kinase [Xanthomonadales bacterium]